MRIISALPSRVCLSLFLVIMIGTSAVATSAIVWQASNNDARLKELIETDSLDLNHGKAVRVAFAKEHSCKEPEAIVDAIGESELADLLLSTAIEESHCGKNAVGAAGEQGAWQVISAHWGPVPKDLYGQARQAEKIIRGLLVDTKGKPVKAMARYNGGDLPAATSIEYARRVTSRQQKIAILVLERTNVAYNALN